ncbi:Heme NO binding protein [Aquimixticola soesokkakensis]|uniref:Heme NO binding protein n=1 Tax=Aquimixticola soesokkakensis TaxID=1519096 RepID=A0A1Y5SC37_9RHOB|nr:heme NO-binding domain-containing protein [Aquimixticola soesokkakensis]SLN37411.1 Heme NO binding protein [Aquimixticola soesokkakensis]
MHGLVNRAIQCFLRDTYGSATWSTVVETSNIGFNDFEAMFVYPDSVTVAVIESACKTLGKPADVILEDIGTYLVTHPNTESLRRLLRFGGETFEEFLYSLNDLKGRAQLALADIEIPNLTVEETAPGAFSIGVDFSQPGYIYAVMGVLRTMADDYGALVYLERGAREGTVERIEVFLLEASFAEGRSFDLAARQGA